MRSFLRGVRRVTGRQTIWDMSYDNWLNVKRDNTVAYVRRTEGRTKLTRGEKRAVRRSARHCAQREREGWR